MHVHDVLLFAFVSLVQELMPNQFWENCMFQKIARAISVNFQDPRKRMDLKDLLRGSLLS